MTWDGSPEAWQDYCRKARLQSHQDVLRAGVSFEIEQQSMGDGEWPRAQQAEAPQRGEAFSHS